MPITSSEAGMVNQPVTKYAYSHKCFKTTALVPNNALDFLDYRSCFAEQTHFILYSADTNCYYEDEGNR